MNLNIFQNFKLAFFNHKGTGHKVAHNMTTIANIPLVAWLIHAVLTLREASYNDFISWISTPFNMSVAIIFVIVTLTHFVLEIEVVLEDYIPDLKRRHMAIKALKIFWFVLGLISIISILKLGFNF